MKLDWSDQFEASIRASRGIAAAGAQEPAASPEAPRKKGEELPPALAAMIEDRRANEREALEAAQRDSIVALPVGTWRELETRAATLGIEAELLSDGGELRIAADLPGQEESAPE